MQITATVLVQLVTFAVLVWLLRRTLWDPLIGLMEERRRRQAEGEAAAERGRRELELAERRAGQIRDAAQRDAERIIAQAERLAAELADAVRSRAHAEATRAVHAATAEMRDTAAAVKQELTGMTQDLARAAAERVRGTAIGPCAAP